MQFIQFFKLINITSINLIEKNEILLFSLSAQKIDLQLHNLRVKFFTLSWLE